jgi:hypothetical protein
MAYSEIGLNDLTDLESAISELLPDSAFSAGTKYDLNMLNPTPVEVIDFPPPRISNRSSKYDYGQLMFKAGTVVSAGDVVNATIGGSSRWFLVAKLLTLGPIILTAIPINALDLEMPYLLSAKRPTPAPIPASALNIWNEPATVDGNGYPLQATTTTTFHAGFANQFNPLDETAVGPLPSGQLSMYTHVGASVLTGDEIDYNSKTYIVDQANLLGANGWFYGLEVILKETGGKGWA